MYRETFRRIKPVNIIIARNFNKIFYLEKHFLEAPSLFMLNGSDSRCNNENKLQLLPVCLLRSLKCKIPGAFGVQTRHKTWTCWIVMVFFSQNLNHPSGPDSVRIHPAATHNNNTEKVFHKSFYVSCDGNMV